MRSNASTMVKTYSCGYPRNLGSPSAIYETAVCFNNYSFASQTQRGSLSVSRTGKEVTLKAIRAGVGWVWLARLFNYKHSDSGTGGVYLVWLFLRITTTCNLPIIGLVRKGFPESLAHAQTVDTRPLFPPPTWPGYEASCRCV